ncbi:hypothetical protein [Muricoccus vinaceus]|uniref:KTSC domain-containing protein n=1 Tax=Muricoccus vinaceus TaxID=424704 RepID=A0ABV6J1D8_9PROT
MIRLQLPGLPLLLVALAAMPVAAETCSSSTLASTEFATARWCGDPPAAGTLRMARKGGRAEDFLDVPLDTFREVVRTPNVSRYVAEEIVPRFERRPVTTVPPRSVLHRAGRAVPPDEAPAPHSSSSRPR